jgi:methionyl-tRNA formyltransferase
LKKHAKIDWNKPVGHVYNLIRGTNPAPGAWTTQDGDEVQVYDASRTSGDGISSKIVEISDAGVTVQCVGGRIVIKRVRPSGDGKQKASDWAASVGLSIGDMLGS